MTPSERWTAYAFLIITIVLLEKRIIEAAVDRAEQRYWERRKR